MTDLFSIHGKIAVVTGGSKGLGLAIARGLAGAGARVVAVARTPPDPDSTEDGRLGFVGCDLAQTDARAGLIDRIVHTAGAVDILVHCAGQQHRAPAIDYPLGMIEEMHQLHVIAGVDLAQQAAKHMLPRRAGKIIFVASVLSFQGGLTVPGYAAAKHAMVGVVKSLANEWAAQGVNVNAIAPGYMATDMITPLLNDPQRGPAILGRIPAQRLGEPDELVGPVIFLASDAARYVHGTTLAVDGGWLAR